MNDGWIKLHRQIVDSDIYQMPPLYLRVFERLIIEANHQDNEIPYKNKNTNILGKKLIKRGERLTSVRDICKWVAWYERGKLKEPNPKTIQSVLDWLEKNSMIFIYGDKGNRKETHYSIVNFNVYQSKDDDKSNAKVTEKKQSADTNKNVKNDKNEKNYLYDYMVPNSDEIQNNTFDFQIVINQINNSCKKIIEEGSTLSYEIDDYIEIFRYFYDGYKAYAGQAHPRIKSNYIKDVIKRLPYIENDTCVGASDVDPEDNKTLIDSYFKQPWGVDIDPTILHFMSGNVRALRFYETLY